MDKPKRIRINNWIISLTINAIILAFIMMFTKLCYETNDDYGIMQRIVSGYDNVLMINKYLCDILIPIQKAFQSSNVFAYFQLICSFASFVAILKVVLDRSSGFLNILMSVAVVAVFSFDHYSVFQFTKTAALLTCAGLIVLADFIIAESSGFSFMLGSLLLICGSMLRFVCAYLAMAFAVVFFIFYLFPRFRSMSPKMIKKAIACVIVVSSTFVLYWVFSHDIDMAEYREYNSLRTGVIDYPVAQNYRIMEEELTKEGLSKNDIFMMRRWYLDYDGAASLDNLRKIKQIYDDKVASDYSISSAFKDFYSGMLKHRKKADYTYMHIIALVALSIFLFTSGKKKIVLYVFAIGILSIGLYVYLYYVGRTVYRSTYSIDINAAMWLLFGLATLIDAKAVERSKELRSRLLRIVPQILCIAVCIGMLSPIKAQCNTKYDNIINGIMSEELSEYMANRKDDIFVFSTLQKDNAIYYLYPLAVPSVDFEANVHSFGGWGTKSEYQMDRLKKCGLDNVFEDIIDNENVYIIDNKYTDKLEEYFNKWYSNRYGQISIEYYDTVDGNKFWQVVSSGKTA